MSKRWIKAGLTDQTIDIFVLDSSSTTGTGLTGLTHSTSGLTCYYRKGATGSSTQLTLATQTVGGAHSDGGFVAIDGTNMPGLYRLDLSDTMVAAEGMLTIYLRGATNMAPVVAELEIVDVDIYDSVRLGLTALPNVASGSAGAIITSGTGTAQLSTAGGAVTAGTVSDKTGYSLATAPPTSADIADAVWDEVLSGHLTAGSTGNALNAAGSAGDPWSTALPGAYGAGTAGKIIGDNLNATVSSRLASSAITLSSGAVTVGTNNDKTGYSLATAPPTSTDIADAVWDEVLSGHLTAGSTGNALNAAGSAGDPWSTALPGAYGAGTAGKIIGDNLNATVSSRLASSAITLASGAVTVGTNNDKTGYSLSQSFPSNFALLAITGGGAVTAGTVSDKTGYSLSSSQTFNITGNITGDLSGSVGSVTGAVGSVTGAVGSVTGAVGSVTGNVGGNVVGSVASVTNAVTVGTINSDVITAASIAAGAVTEIAQGVLTEATSTNTATYAAGDVGNVLGRLHNMIEADGADFRYTTNALEQAPSGGGGGGGSTTVRMGPFTVVAEGQGSDETLDINKAATHGIDCKLVDAFGTGIDLTGATVDVYIYSSAGALVTSVAATGTYEAGGDITWTIPTTVTNTAGTYTAAIRRETSATDIQYFGPLRILVRDN